MQPSRRGFLQAGVAGAAMGAGLMTPGTARAESDRLFAFAQEQRRHSRRARQETLGRMDGESSTSKALLADPRVPAIARGLAAFGSVRAIQDLSLRDQAHPAVQSLIEDVAAEVGGAVSASHELMVEYLESDAPDREELLRGGLGQIRASIPSWQAPDNRRHQLVSAILRLERTRPGHLEKRVRRLSDRLGRLKARAERMAQDPLQGASPMEDPQAIQEISEGRQLWVEAGALELSQAKPSAPERMGAGGGGANSQQRKDYVGLKLLGFILLVVGTILGVGFFLAGLCMVACGAPEGILIMLLGIGIGALCFWGYSRIQKTIHKGDKRFAALPEGSAPVLLDSRDLSLPSAAQWVSTGLSRTAEHFLTVVGTGVVRVDGLSPLGADGAAEAAGPGALVPEAPVGALVGRVGDDVFYLGSEARVPDGPDGELCLAINQRKRGEHTGLGAFQVALDVYDQPSA